MIHLETGDCLPYLLAGAFQKRNAWICDPPANIAFMGRKWDRRAPHAEFVPYIEPRSAAHLRELQSEHAFKTYWGERFAAMYDASEDDAIAIVWAMPRTINLTMDALKVAGWQVFDTIEHAFGTGWNKNGSLLKPAHEPWILARKGKGRLNTEACRVPRGGTDLARANPNGVRMFGGDAIAGTNRAQSRKNAGLPPDGSHPANLVLSHHEGCVRIGERKIVGGSENVARVAAPRGSIARGIFKSNAVTGYGTNGSEAIPSFACVAGCDRCGSWWTEPDGASPSVCACGGEGVWACPVARLNEESGQSVSPGQATRGAGGGKSAYGAIGAQGVVDCPSDAGGASRFFNTFTSLVYAGKSSGRIDAEGVPSGERHAGCEELYWRANRENPFGFDRVTRAEWEAGGSEVGANAYGVESAEGAASRGRNPRSHSQFARGNVHPTVKNLDFLMRLVKLSGGDKIGDLCAGSGGMAITCQLLGLDFWGAELCPEAVEITRARLAFWGGLSLSALEAFRLTGEVPTRAPVDARQGSLF